MLVAMCTVLAAIALKLGGNLKITFESVPVHIGALLFGPVDGMIIGGPRHLPLPGALLRLRDYGHDPALDTAVYRLRPRGRRLREAPGLLPQPRAAHLHHGRERARHHAAQHFALYVDSRLYGYYSAPSSSARWPCASPSARLRRSASASCCPCCCARSGSCCAGPEKSNVRPAPLMSNMR